MTWKLTLTTGNLSLEIPDAITDDDFDDIQEMLRLAIRVAGRRTNTGGSAKQFSRLQAAKEMIERHRQRQRSEMSMDASQLFEHSHRTSHKPRNAARELIVDNFAGGGGASLGIERAIGRAVDLAINHSPDAMALHQTNHPDTWHLVEDLFAVDPVQATRGLPVGLAWFSPDCFPAGTLILTYEGYRPIEEVGVGELVLTHKGRWRQVTATMESVKDTVLLEGRGHPSLEISTEHPVYVRRSKQHDPEWIKVSDLSVPSYWATPKVAEPITVPSTPKIDGIRRLWWIVGRYLADGWSRIRRTNSEMVLSIGKQKAGSVREILADTGIKWGERETATAIQFTCYRAGLVTWLRTHFGHLSHGKTIPGWCTSLPIDCRQELLDGYFAGDGWRGGNLNEANTVSKFLAFGLRLLVESLGFPTSLYSAINDDTTIDGRIIHSDRIIYKVKWRESIDTKHVQHIEDDLHRWYRLRKIHAGRRSVKVFNLSVDEDESYVAEGVVTHNCKHFSRAKGAKPVEKKIRGLAWVVVKWARAVRPRLIFLENVREFQDWGPLVAQYGCNALIRVGANDRACGWRGVKHGECPRCGGNVEAVLDKRGRQAMVPDPARKGQTFKRWLAQLRSIGYHVEFRILNAADYGAPTHRRRLFLVARLDGLPIHWPAETHGPNRRRKWRTASECIDWQIPCKSIFDRKKPLAEKTMRRIAHGIKRYVLDAAKPFIVPVTHNGERRSHGIDEPLPTVTGANRGELALVAPSLVGIGGAEYAGKPKPVDEPSTTVLPNDRRHVVAAFLSTYYGGNMPTDVHRGNAADEPPRTQGTENRHALAAANLIQMNFGGKQWHAVDDPLCTIMAQSNKFALVYSFLVKYFGCGIGQVIDEPLHTVTTKDRFGVITVSVDGQLYAIVDIGLRMLEPRELATAQGFPAEYLLPMTKSKAVSAIGNSVCPQVAEALVKANYSESKPVAKPARRRPTVDVGGSLLFSPGAFA